MPFTVVIADDVTGANDIGIMYAKAGLDTVVYSYNRLDEKEEFHDTVTVIDTNSRFLTREEAYARVFKETKRFRKEEVHQFIDKQCSVFRGNIGAEFDAMLDALEEEFAVVVLGFPDNGRRTVNSIHYVHGTELKDSQFRNDPVHPMTESNLVDILQKQTVRKVGAIPYPVIDLGADALRSELERMRSEVNYVILDVRDNADLEVIARAVKDEKIICGSSAIGYYLGKLEAEEKGPSRSEQTPKGGWAAPTETEKTEVTAETERSAAGAPENGARSERIFCIAGSLTPQTKAQTDWMRKQGHPVFELDTTRLFDVSEREKEKLRILNACRTAYETAQFVMVHSMQEPEDVERTKSAAAIAGIGNTEVSEMVSGLLAEICEDMDRMYAGDGGIGGFIICGGDTSGAFCERMKIKGMRVLEEIQPGLPTCRSVTAPFYKMVLKSGSFGDERFLGEAMRAI